MSFYDCPTPAGIDVHDGRGVKKMARSVFDMQCDQFYSGSKNHAQEKKSTAGPTCRWYPTTPYGENLTPWPRDVLHDTVLRSTKYGGLLADLHLAKADGFFSIENAVLGVVLPHILSLANKAISEVD